MSTKFDLYNKLKQMRVEYKKNPSPELEEYIEKLASKLKMSLGSYKVFSRLRLIANRMSFKEYCESDQETRNQHDKEFPGSDYKYKFQQMEDQKDSDDQYSNLEFEQDQLNQEYENNKKAQEDFETEKYVNKHFEDEQNQVQKKKNIVSKRVETLLKNCENAFKEALKNRDIKKLRNLRVNYGYTFSHYGDEVRKKYMDILEKYDLIG